jgi:putative mRNA 3-end processing factor
MKLKFHGATKEVGRSCIVLNGRYMLDAGLDLSEGVKYPTITDVSRIEAVLLCHGHLDHSGALPLFNSMGLDCPIFATIETKKIAKILLKDEYKLQRLLGKHPAYSKFNITNIMAGITYIDFGMQKNIGDISFTYIPSGHIPGSSSALIDVEGKKLLYTSDINTKDTLLMAGAKFMPNADIMICEATYGNRDHPPREVTEGRFIDAVKKTLDRGGSVIVPVFAVGRAQEIMLLLYEKLDYKVPIYLDGMADDVTRAVLEEPQFIRNPAELRKAYQKVKVVKKNIRRIDIVKEQSVIVTTSGMLDGGPVIDYLKHTHFDEKNSILITGYQPEGCNGRMLMDTGRIVLDEQVVNVKAHYEQFDFSAHLGRAEIIELIKKVDPKILILNHGETDAINSLASEFRNKKVYIPELDEEILI